MQAARQIRFTSAKEVTALASTIKAYILEGIELEKSGAKVEYKQTDDFEVAPEFEARLRSTPSLKTAFEADGRQRGYLLFFRECQAIRHPRAWRCVRQIYNGKGLQD